jgi:hypothetical protein
LRWRPFKETTAATAEDGITAKQQGRDASGEEGDMVQGMPWNIIDLEQAPHDAKFVPLAHYLINIRDIRVVGADNMGRVTFDQFRQTTRVILMVMGDQYRAKGEVLAIEKLDDRVGITGIDHADIGIRILAEQPYIVVAKGGNRCHAQHRQGVLSGKWRPTSFPDEGKCPRAALQVGHESWLSHIIVAKPCC